MDASERPCATIKAEAVQDPSAFVSVPVSVFVSKRSLFESIREGVEWLQRGSHLCVRALTRVLLRSRVLKVLLAPHLLVLHLLSFYHSIIHTTFATSEYDGFEFSSTQRTPRPHRIFISGPFHSCHGIPSTGGVMAHRSSLIAHRLWYGLRAILKSPGGRRGDANTVLPIL